MKRRRLLGLLFYWLFLLLAVLSAIGLVRSRFVDERFVLEKVRKSGPDLELSYDHHRGVIIAKSSQIDSDRSPGLHFGRISKKADPVGLAGFDLGLDIRKREAESGGEGTAGPSTAILTSYWLPLTVGIIGTALAWFVFLRIRREPV